MCSCVLFKNQLKQKQNNFEQTIIEFSEFDRRTSAPPNTRSKFRHFLSLIKLKTRTELLKGDIDE